MSQLKFLIVEDDTVSVQRLKVFLTRAGYSPHMVWPPGDSIQVFATWSEVRTKLLALQREGWQPSEDCCVLLLDLALPPGADPRPGIAEIREHYSGFYESYAIVAYSQAGAHVSENPQFDGIIQKTDLGSNEADDAQRVKRSIEKAVQAWSSRTHRAAPSLSTVKYRLLDSAAARFAVAALGETAIDYLISALTAHWSDVRAHALTGGLSGAFVLRIDGQMNGVDRSVVCKVAQEGFPLGQELTAWTQARETVVAAGLIAHVHAQVHRIPGEPVRYLTLATVPGSTLEQALTGTAVPLARMLEEVGRFIIESARATRLESAAELLPMTPSDLSRIGVAIRQLHELGSVCVARGLLADGQVINAATRDALCALIEGWSTNLARPDVAKLAAYPQHGDLHARNVLIGGSGQPALIDWARYRAWPIAYDVQRLELQLLLRVFATRRMADLFVDGVAPLWPLWSEMCCEDLAKPLTVPHPDDTGLFGVLEELRRVRGTVLDDPLSPVDRPQRVRSFHAGRCHDALRICAYQDVSPLKQLFFLHVAAESAVAAGFIKRTP